MKKLAVIIPIILGLLAIGTYIIQYDSSLAKASDVLKIRQEIKLINERYAEDQRIRRIQAIQERVWVLEERYTDKPMPTSVKEEYRRLKFELAALQGA